MLSFSLVAEALTGLIYHRPSGENSKFAFADDPILPLWMNQARTIELNTRKIQNDSILPR